MNRGIWQTQVGSSYDFKKLPGIFPEANFVENFDPRRLIIAGLPSKILREPMVMVKERRTKGAALAHHLAEDIAQAKRFVSDARRQGLGIEASK